MIDYNSFSIDQLRAVNEVLDYITDMLDADLVPAIVYREYRIANKVLHMAIEQQARAAGEALPAKVQLSSLYGTCVADPPADPPAAPDMFGWVGDALDDLCAAGEVLGSND